MRRGVGAIMACLMVAPIALAGPEHTDTAARHAAIPEAMKAEHDELNETLSRATREQGELGVAAKAVAKALHPHFLKEEELALPPLGLLPRLARGEVTPEMAEVVPMTDRLETELGQMLAEHKVIVEALKTFAAAAERSSKPEFRAFAEKLIRHAKTEEEVTYPAAILVGRYLKLTLKR